MGGSPSVLRVSGLLAPLPRADPDLRTQPNDEPGLSLDPGWRLLLLRAFELINHGATVALSAGAQRVLAFLALNDRPLGRSYVAGHLWPDTSDKRASGSLRTAICDLRLADRDLVDTSGGCLRLAPHVHVDFRSAVTLAGQILDPRQPCPGVGDEWELLRGDLLADWYDEWVIVERERFRHLRLHLLEALCERLTQERQFARAVDAGVAAVAADPLRDSAQRVLIRAHLAEGNRIEAIRQYESYESLLHEELNIEPSAEMRALMSQPEHPWAAHAAASHAVITASPPGR